MTVAKNPVKEVLHGGGVSIGTLVMEFGSTGIARLAASAGAEFVLFDMEHTGWSLDRIRTLVASTRGTPALPFVRVPSLDARVVSRVLDLGALGVMVPAVEDAAQALRLVSEARFPPAGERRFGIIFPDELEGGLRASMDRHDDAVLTIAQIETAGGVEHVDEIAAVDGLDVLWLGPYDLSISLGVTEELDHPRYTEAVDRMLAACARHGKVAGVLVEGVDEGRRALEQGFRCLMYGFDAALYGAALEEGVRGLRSSSSISRVR
jgi:2-dehydro-3-deoxyglucarate aldolase/4-hydroxy-2-oxoheptanedioate aldolase